MVVFQNKIIYMPGMPPSCRWEKIDDYKNQLRGIAWREERVKAVDGTDLALCVADLELGPKGTPNSAGTTAFYVLYFQGSQNLSYTTAETDISLFPPF